MPCRFVAKGLSIGNAKVKVLVDKDLRVYLANVGDSDLTVGPVELFGFNAGSFKECVTGPTSVISFNLSLSDAC